jgi:hypothetical protein
MNRREGLMSLLDAAKRKSSEPSLVEGQMKRRIRELVRAYRHSWDIYSELLQNSVDAINRRYRILNDPDFYLYAKFRQRYPDLVSDQMYTGQIGIAINIQNREIEIKDNGVGISYDLMEEFLLPEAGDKQVGQEYGFKGFGLTYAAFISEHFYLASKAAFSEKEAHELSLEGLFSWLTDDHGATLFPNRPIPDASTHKGEWNSRWNTIVRVKLADDYTAKFPAISSADQAIKIAGSEDRLDGFEFLLRTKTAVGNTRVLFSSPPTVPIDVKLEVVTQQGRFERNVPYRYYHPKDHDEMAQIVYDFADYYERYKRPSFSRNFRALYHPVTDQEVGTRKPIRCDYALCAIASRRLSQIESALKLDEIESGDIGVTYGVHLSINGMPTGLRIDDWDTKGGYLKRFYVVVDADLSISSQLDPGRKGISQYFARLISEKSVDLIGSVKVEDSDSFGSYAARHLDHGQGREEGGLPPQDFQIKIIQTQQDAMSSKFDAEYTELRERLKAFSSLNFLPSDEQEVIALFYELQKQDFIKGYRTVYLSGSAVYDAAFEYEIECKAENIYDADPLGIGKVLVQQLKSRGESSYSHRNHYAGQTTLPELCVEFKKSIGGFLEEIYRRSGKTPKDPRQINLLIVWDIDIPSSIPQTMYTLAEITGTQRFFHGTTHRLGLIGDQTTEIRCIILKEVLKMLHRPPQL